MIAAAKIDRRATAIHEAGHAVMAASTPNGRVLSVDIIPNYAAGRAGLTRYRPPAFIPARIACTIAGPLAEKWFLQLDTFSPGSSSDLEGIDTYLSEKYGEPTRRYETGEYEDALILARGTLWSKWGAVLHLGQWLLNNSQASGQLVHAIVEQHDKLKGRT
jgi:hypothetical protein